MDAARLAGIGEACPDELAGWTGLGAYAVSDYEVVADDLGGVCRIDCIPTSLALVSSGPSADKAAWITGLTGVIAEFLIHAHGAGLQALMVFQI